MTIGLPTHCMPGRGLPLMVPGVCGHVELGMRMTLWWSTREEARLRQEIPLSPYTTGQCWGEVPSARHTLLPPEEIRGAPVA